MRVGRKRALATIALAGCATLADGAPGLDNPPSARAGPFRALAVGELGQNHVAPQAVDPGKRRLRDLSVVDVDGDPATLPVDGYLGASATDAGPEDPSIEIVVAHAEDGRTFSKETTSALVPVHDWEGGRVGAPSAIIGADGETRLYYEAEGGIGVAVGDKGALVSVDHPILTPTAVPWATGSLRSPGVVLLPDGTYRLYFEADRGSQTVVGVASSDDGSTFSDPSVVLAPSPLEGAIDDVAVGSPSATIGTSEEGRDILYVYYAALSSDGKRRIGMAARFLADDDEALVKSGEGMYAPSGGVDPREPSVVRFDSFTFLFATQKAARDSTDLVVIAAVSPGNIELPPPDPP